MVGRDHPGARVTRDILAVHKSADPRAGAERQHRTLVGAFAAGIIVGAVVISVLPEMLRGAADYRFFVFGVLLIAMMIFRPQGIWPHRVREVVDRPGHGDRPGPVPEPATASGESTTTVRPEVGA